MIALDRSNESLLLFVLRLLLCSYKTCWQTSHCVVVVAAVKKAAAAAAGEVTFRQDRLLFGFQLLKKLPSYFSKLTSVLPQHPIVNESKPTLAQQEANFKFLFLGKTFFLFIFFLFDFSFLFPFFRKRVKRQTNITSFVYALFISLTNAHVVSRNVSESQVKAEEVKIAVLPLWAIGNIIIIGQKQKQVSEI